MSIFFLIYCGRCAWILDPGPKQIFLVHRPPNPWFGVQGLNSASPSPPPLWALAGEDTVSICRLKLSGKFHFFLSPSVASGMGFGDHLVTVWVLKHPWGPTWWPLGQCNSGHRTH